MGTRKLYDSEVKLMELLWEAEPVSAKDLSSAAAERIGWNKNTTYTVLKKLVEKGYVRREDPGFLCSSLISRKDAERAETRSLIDKLFHGSRKAFLAAFLEDESLDSEEASEIEAMIRKAEEKKQDK